MNKTTQESIRKAFAAPFSVWFAAAAVPLAAQEADQAEDASDDDIEEVVVTVERREQNLQDLGVTAYSFQGDDLKMQGAQDLTDLSELAPGLEIGNKGGNVEVWIRGVGSSNNTELGDPAAATHLDGVYLPRTAGIGSAFFDIGRVEVNVGPQGTLRGRNATAGSVNIIPWRPGLGRRELAVEAEIGDYSSEVLRAVVNAPLGERAAVRLAGYSTRHDSYYNDVGPLGLDTAEAADNTGYRLQLLVDVNDRLSVLFAYDSVHEQGTGWTGTNYANPLGNGVEPGDIEDPRDVYARAFAPILDTTHWGAKLEITYDFDWGTAEYTASRRDLLYDYDAATPLSPDWPGVANELQPVDEVFDNWSRFQFITDSVSDIQELRFYGDTGPWTWTSGLFWFEEDQYTFLGSAGDRGLFFQGIEFNQPNTDSSSTSAYGDVTYHVTDTTRLTLGLRYSEEEKSRVGVNARYAFASAGATSPAAAACASAPRGSASPPATARSSIRTRTTTATCRTRNTSPSTTTASPRSAPGTTSRPPSPREPTAAARRRRTRCLAWTP